MAGPVLSQLIARVMCVIKKLVGGRQGTDTLFLDVVKPSNLLQDAPGGLNGLKVLLDHLGPGGA